MFDVAPQPTNFSTAGDRIPTPATPTGNTYMHCGKSLAHLEGTSFTQDYWQEDTHLGFLAGQLARAVRGRTAIVMDTSNMCLAAPSQDVRLDFRSVRMHFGGNALEGAHAVLSLPPAGVAVSSRRRAMVTRLAREGWTTHAFNALASSLGSSEGWHEDEAAVDGQVRTLIRQYAHQNTCENIVVLSGDGGMTTAVREARRNGKRVLVAAWAGAINPALAAAANKFLLLDAFYPLLGYQQKPDRTMMS